MGRATGGGGGHSSHNGGGHSSSHSSGGHRVSGGRAGAGRNHSYSFSGGGSYYHSSYHYGPSGYYCRPRMGGTVAIVITIVFLVIILSVGAMVKSQSSTIPKSTVQRERIETEYGYDNNCIIDELGWFDNVERTETRLREFWEETGVQPMILLKSYDAALTTDKQKEDWANTYYRDNITREDVFLYVYFAEQNQDDDVGYMAYVNGNKTGTVMDAEAIDIFWSYIDNEWYGDKSTDDLFVTVYNKTADRIMSKTTTGFDVAKWLIILLCIIAAGVIVIVVIKKIREHARKSAEETAQILNAGKNQQTFSETEELADKWKNYDTPDN